MPQASIAQLAERTLRKRTVVGSIPTGGFAWLGTSLGRVSIPDLPSSIFFGTH